MEVMVNYQILSNAYRGKKVFLTGHTGFKGSWLLKTLTMLGAEVKGYALEPYTSNDLFCLIDGSKLCHSVLGDIRNRNELEKSIIDFQPDFIFHLAAQPLVRLSYEIPADTFEVNVIGTANLLDSVKKLRNKCNVIVITTDKVYHNNEWVYPYRESDRLGGFDPYSASKACTEILIDSYRNSFFNVKEQKVHQKGVAVARAGNVIGGGDWSKDRLIPDIVKSLLSEQEIVVRNPNSVRPWQHVLEPVIGYLILGLKLNEFPTEFSQAFNFGPRVDEAFPVETILKMFLKSWGSGIYRCESEINSPHEASMLKLDISKANEQLNWAPKFNINDTIRFTSDWYKNFYADKDQILDFTAQQINNYLSR